MRRGLSAVMFCAWAVLALPAPAQAFVGEFFTYTGSEQTFTVPDGVHRLLIAAAGGRGGGTTDASGGKGAVVGGFVSVAPGATLYVEVGGNGKSQLEGGAGGFNGGGTAGVGPGGGGGGGATDVRTRPRADGLSPDPRLIVAAGGGGAGGTGMSSIGGKGGDAGQNGVEAPESEGEGGGGEKGTAGGGEGGSGCIGAGGDGDLGLGGEGSAGEKLANGGGGGGGGLWGGGGGGGGCETGGGGGGGGSSLIPGGGAPLPGNPEPAVEILYTKPPTVEISSPVTGASFTQGQAVSAAYTCDSPEGVSIEKCSGSVADGAALETSTLGSHTLTVEAEDSAEATASASATYTVVPPALAPSPALAPNTTLGSHPKKTVRTRKKKAKVKFSFSSDVAGATFHCKLDKGAFAPCASPKSYSVKMGSHTFSVRAVGAGGSDASPATFSFKVKKKK